MLIEIHMIQNHSPANLNRDDLGAPKTCYFGGVLRSRISSQCIKRSIRMSDQFSALLGGVATRQLARLIAGENASQEEIERATRILRMCGIAPKQRKGRTAQDEADDDRSAGRVYTTWTAVRVMSEKLKEVPPASDKELAAAFAKIIAEETAAPDMALCGRMLEPKKPENTNKGAKGARTDGETGDSEDGGKKKGVWKGLDLSVEAALQVSHALSTHEARPEVDYYVAADDVPGDDAGAAFVDEALFASACFYKYFSIHWEQLTDNLRGFAGNRDHLAAHTVGAFLRAAACVSPSGKQNSFAAHNPPDGILVEVRDANTPVSYANAFAHPVVRGDGDLITQSVTQLARYVRDLDVGYGRPKTRLWFSPNLRHPLNVVENESKVALADDSLKSLDELVPAVVKEIGYDWDEVQKVVINKEAV